MAVLNIKINLKTSFGSFSIWDDFFLPFAASWRPPSSSFLMVIPVGQHVYILHTQDYKILIYTPQFSGDLIICLGSRQTFTMGLSKQHYVINNLTHQQQFHSTMNKILLQKCQRAFFFSQVRFSWEGKSLLTFATAVVGSPDQPIARALCTSLDCLQASSTSFSGHIFW